MTLKQRLELLPTMAVNDLRLKYADAFGEPTNANNKDWLVKRIAWRLQAQALGGLSERAQARAKELANEADLRVNPPKDAITPTVTPDLRDERLPVPGSVISRTYKGRHYEVEVLASGFRWNDQTYTTLTAVAKAITNQHVNGYAFFQINKEATV